VTSEGLEFCCDSSFASVKVWVELLQSCTYLREGRSLLRDTCIPVAAACILVALVLGLIGMIKVKERLCKVTEFRCKGRMRTLLP
jgi:hypothetical protein